MTTRLDVVMNANLRRDSGLGLPETVAGAVDPCWATLGARPDILRLRAEILDHAKKLEIVKLPSGQYELKSPLNAVEKAMKFRPGQSLLFCPARCSDPHCSYVHGMTEVLFRIRMFYTRGTVARPEPPARPAEPLAQWHSAFLCVATPRSKGAWIRELAAAPDTVANELADLVATGRAARNTMLQSWFPRWAAGLLINRLGVCQRFNSHNHCANKGCKYTHVCMLCGSPDHGLFENENGPRPASKMICPKHRRLVAELQRTGCPSFAAYETLLDDIAAAPWTRY